MNNILSEVAKVNISSETMNLATAPLTNKKRRELRQQGVLDYIRSKPAGTKISMKEFSMIYRGTRANTDAFIKRMVRDELIQRHNLGIKTFYYTIPGDVTLKEPVPNKNKQTIAGLRTEHDDHHTNVKTVESNVSVKNGALTDYVKENYLNATLAPADGIERRAQQFAWSYPESHNDLREFIRWLKSQK